MQVKTKNLIVVVLAVVMISAVWYRLIYSPIKSKTSKANAAAQNAETDSKNLQDAIDNIMAANKKSAEKDVGTAQMLTAVPADAAEASFLRSLDTIRVGSGADWQSVTPGAPSASGGVTSITINITVNGNETSLASYLNGLYSMHRIFVPDNVTLANLGCLDPSTCGNGALFKGGPMTMTVSGRIFAGPTAVPSTGSGTSGAGGSSTTGAATTATH